MYCGPCRPSHALEGCALDFIESPARSSTARHALTRRGICVAALLVGFVSLPFNTLAADPPAKPAAVRPALSVQVVEPRSADMAVRLSANGSIAAWQEAIIGSEVQGLRLAELKAQVGDRVRKGQVLAVFAAETVLADLAQAQAAVAEAEASLAEAAANAQRARELQPTGVLSTQQVQERLTAERVALARVDAQRAHVRVFELRLKQTTVVAPDEGIISVRLATLGAVMPAGQEMFRLIRQGRLEWRAELPAAELTRITPGMAVTVKPPGGGAVTGRVRMVAPTVDPATRNGFVYVDLPVAGVARPGMFAPGEFDIAQRQALTLPQSAVVLREGFSFVFLVGPDNKVRQQKVEIGRRQGDRVEIAAGLATGARVVAAGGGFLADGDTVRVVAASPVAPAASR
jgi:RND family efflux transporter MFP subunit